MTQMVARFRCGVIKTRRRPTAAISGDMPSLSESRRTFENPVPAKPPPVLLIAYGRSQQRGQGQGKASHRQQGNRNGWIECGAIHTKH
jgi:hypothetical protein